MGSLVVCYSILILSNPDGIVVVMIQAPRIHSMLKMISSSCSPQGPREGTVNSEHPAVVVFGLIGPVQTNPRQALKIA